MTHRYARLGLILLFVLFSRAANAQTTLFSETFDGVVAPTLPAGWTVTSGNGWKTDAASASSGSGGNNLAHAGSAAGFLMSPIIDLSTVTSGNLTYLARRTSTYDQANLTLTASTDGGATFTTIVLAGTALPATTGSWSGVTVSLPAVLLGQAQVVLRFEGAGGTSSGSSARIDDFTITGTVAAAGGLTAAPASLSFSAPPGGSETKSVTLTNAGADAVEVAAPVVTGTAFSIAPAGTTSLAAGASASFSVTFSPATAGTFSGTVAFADDTGGSASVSLSGTSHEAGSSAFGFPAAASRTLEESDAIEIPLALSFSNEEPLQGIQFTIGWDTSLVQLTGIGRGAAVANEQAWQLSFEVSGTSVTVVLMGNGTSGLPAGAYDPFLDLELSAGAIGARDSLLVGFALSGMVGSLATPTGDDAGVATATANHTLIIERRKAFFVATPPSLGFLNVDAGQSSPAEVTVTNAAGTRDLAISAVASSNPLFTVAPTEVVIAPNAAATFTVTFSPTRAVFGRQTTELTFTHDGESGPSDVIEAAGTGVRGRGDTDGDGIVDVVDLIESLDFVLGRLSPDDDARASADLFPFPEGDGLLDVRDLTVMAQAIARGLWPDELSIPLEVQPAVAAGKGGVAGVEASFQSSGGGVSVMLEHEVPIRGVQLVLDAPGGAPRVILEGAPAVGTVVLTGYDDGSARILFYRTDGGLIAPGRYALALFSEAPGTGAARYATAVDGHNTRIPVTVAFEEWTGADEKPTLPEEFQLRAPYPNPFSPGLSPLVIPIELPGAAHLEVGVYDILGRRVATVARGTQPAGTARLEWDGRDARGRAVGPGLYILQGRTSDRRFARAAVVVQ